MNNIALGINELKSALLTLSLPKADLTRARKLPSPELSNKTLKVSNENSQ